MATPHQAKGVLPLDGIEHLIIVGRLGEIAGAIDASRVGRLLLGRHTAFWLAPALGLVPKVFPTAAAWLLALLVLWQMLAGIVVVQARRRSDEGELRNQVAHLRNCLSWMQQQIFSNDKDVRITIMVPNAKRTELRVFLRPIGFPCTSTTRLSCDSNVKKVQGVAGAAFHRNQTQTLKIELDEGLDDEERLRQYASICDMSLDQASRLTRKALYYLAVPLGGLYGNPVGVLIVDNMSPSLMPEATQKDELLGENAVLVIATWIAELLPEIPLRVIHRAP